MVFPFTALRTRRFGLCASTGAPAPSAARRCWRSAPWRPASRLRPRSRAESLPGFCRRTRPRFVLFLRGGGGGKPSSGRSSSRSPFCLSSLRGGKGGGRTGVPFLLIIILLAGRAFFSEGGGGLGSHCCVLDCVCIYNYIYIYIFGRVYSC